MPQGLSKESGQPHRLFNTGLPGLLRASEQAQHGERFIWKTILGVVFV